MTSETSRHHNKPNEAHGLAGCEREPIHVPGSVQPHGLLLVVDPKTDLILQCAGAISLLACGDALCGLTMEAALGVSLEGLLHGAATRLRRDPKYLGAVGPFGGQDALAVTGHSVHGVAVIEIQLAFPAASAAATLAEIRSITERIGGAENLLEACALAAEEVRRITGYERVLVYQFLPDHSGSVIAQAAGEQLSSLLNHRFPEADIPQQARELYLRSMIRVIPNVEYVAAALEPNLSPATGQPLDMSHCMLRSVSPVHIRYLKNMGVGASMSVSLVSRGGLWGLIAGHHTTPKFVPYEAEEACRHVGQILSQKIAAHDETERFRMAHNLEVGQHKVLRPLSHAENPGYGILTLASTIRLMVPSDGAAVIWKNAVTTAGPGLNESHIRDLAAWVTDRMSGGDYFATDRLAEEYPEAAAFASEASGLLSVILPGDDPALLMWFRSEQVEEIQWAGNPHEHLEQGASIGTLNPRKSFEVWRETVTGRSRPWEPAEIESVLAFIPRAAFILQQKKVRELNRSLGEANARLAAMASTDALTGVANRRAFDECLEAEWARATRAGQPLALVILDVDFFKQYNDRYGHAMGDECLKRIARVLQEGRRSGEVAARIGGEEFSLLLPDTDSEGALIVAERARFGIEALGLEHGGSPMGIVTASFGVAATTAPSTEDMQHLMKIADQALYQAKAAGRNRIAHP